MKRVFFNVQAYVTVILVALNDLNRKNETLLHKPEAIAADAK